MPSGTTSYWTHPSVLRFAGNEDPVALITKRARSLAFEAMESGWTGPPYDPFFLTDLLQLNIVPTEDVHDARTVPLRGQKAEIQFNPNSPRGRLRYTIAHEIAHRFFPDCNQRIRNRLAREHMQKDDWQLEMLCNIAAAELLMPVGSFPELKEENLNIDLLMRLREKFDVSSEAILLRAIKLTNTPCLMFAASRRQDGISRVAYVIDYVVPSRSFPGSVSSGTVLSRETVLRECTAIGFTAKSDEEWPGLEGTIHVEAVGIPPYPKHRFPRVVGIAQSLTGEKSKTKAITYLKGDVTQPRGSGQRLIAQVVNDRTPRWGGGFPLVVRRRFPVVQEDFRRWTASHGNRLTLGDVRLSELDDQTAVVSMIAQHGLGRSKEPRIRYRALQSCLEKLGDIALDREASVHLPRIGCGQAGGSWVIVSEIIERCLCDRGIDVIVYDLPNSEPRPSQLELFDS